MLARFALVWFAVLAWGGCSSKKDTLPYTPMEQPYEFGTPVYGTGNQLVTEAGFTLGKALFFDPALSADSTISCGSCHVQAAAFADTGKALSAGIHGQPTKRNSPTIQNLAWRTDFMWDGGITHLEMQPTAPIGNPGEMGPSFAAIVDKVSRYPRYKTLTQAAFGSDTLNSQRFLQALAQYMATLVSAHSRYDAYAKGDTTALSPFEAYGLQVFTNKGCVKCHTPPLFTNNSVRNNGLEYFSFDGGRFVITQQPADRGKFHVPTLRNVARSAPYMHDGRFATLADVVEFYRTGVQNPPNQDAAIPTRGIQMTNQEADALLAFLQTLTDNSFLTNPNYSKR
jgi:cytochrome c peroxidase